MHLPIAALQTGTFGSQGRIASELMHREGKIAKDQPHTWMILFYQLIEKRGEVGTGWAFEIAEFFERNRSLRVAANMNGFRRAPSGHRFICGDGYATGLIAFTLEQVEAPQARAPLQRALAWLSRNQIESDGRWPAVSLNNNRPVLSDTGLFMSDAATAYAVLALTNAPGR